MDFIFIIGDDVTLPHTEYGRKLMKLIKVSNDANKVIFLCGGSFFSLVYHFACPNNVDLNILNINKQFQTIEDIKQIPSEIKNEITLKDRYLDYTTGDLYNHNNDTSEWIPYENIGYHNRILAAKFKERGKLVQFKEEQRKEGKISLKLNNGKSNEVRCFIAKKINYHWLLKHLENEFCVETDSDWDAHPIIFNNKIYEYTILADSNKGIIIIEKDNCLSCNFYINDKYSSSKKILELFINHHFINIFNKHQKHEEQKKSIVKKEPSVIKFNYNLVSNIKLAKSSGNYFKETSSKRFSDHVGFNFNNKNAIYLAYNSVMKESIHDKTDIKDKNTHKQNQSVDFEKNKEYQIDQKKIITSMHPKASDVLKNDDYVINIKLQKVINEDPFKNLSKEEYFKKDFQRIKNELDKREKEEFEEKNAILKKKNYYKPKEVILKEPNSCLYVGNNKNTINNNQENNISSIENIHQLHVLDDDQLADYYIRESRHEVTKLVKEIELAAFEKKQINGFTMSSIDQGKKKLTLSLPLKNVLNSKLDKQDENSSLDIIQKSPKKVCTYDLVLTDNEYRKNMFHNIYPYINYDLVPKEKNVFIPVYSLEKMHMQNEMFRLKSAHKSFYNNYNKKYKKFESELNTFADKACIRASSEYKTNDEIKRREEINSKKLWLNKKDFQSVFPLNKEEAILKFNYQQNDYEKSNPMLHQFRDLNKTNWIDGNFKFKY